MTLSQDANHSLIGTLLKNSYRIEAELGRGSMGVVYQGTQTALSRPVAIKVIHPQCHDTREYIDRFLFEAQVVSQVNHPNIVNVIDFGQHKNNVLFLVMEYLHGKLLSDFVSPGGLHLNDVTWVMKQICAGISAVHAVPIIHRDLKPNNIMIANLSGGSQLVKVLDFGICKSVETNDNSLTQSGAIIGTPGYISPEQIHFEHNTSTYSDIYSLGSLLYFLITGKNPYYGSSTQILMAQQTAKPPKKLIGSQLNDPRCQSLWPIVQKAMSYYPDDRYHSASELVDALEEIESSELPTISSAPKIRQTLRRKQAKSKRNKLIAVGTGCTAIVAAAAGWINYSATSPESVEFAALESSILNSQTALRFGMTADFSSMAADVGKALKTGINARFLEQNAQGGIHGIPLQLEALDDKHNPMLAKENATKLLADENLLGLIGTVGTAPTVAILDELTKKQRLLFGAYSGARVLRANPPSRYVFNFRASYDQELDELLRYFKTVQKIKTSEIAILRPQSSAIDSNRWSIEDMGRRLLARYGFDRAETVDMTYQLANPDLSEALALFKDKQQHVKAVIILAPYSISAEFISAAYKIKPGTFFSNLSFVGSEQLAAKLTAMNDQVPSNVIVTQVVPNTASHSTVVENFKRTLKTFYPETPVSAAALEGYLSAGLLIEGLKRAERPYTSSSLIDALESIKGIDLGTGSQINLSASDHDASDTIWTLTLNSSGTFEQLKFY